MNLGVRFNFQLVFSSVLNDRSLTAVCHVCFFVDANDFKRFDVMRFAQDGVSFRGKLIGVLEVSEPRGEKMCQEAMADLKMAIKAAGEHKRKIIIGIALDGLRLRDEGTRVGLQLRSIYS